MISIARSKARSPRGFRRLSSGARRTDATSTIQPTTPRALSQRRRAPPTQRVVITIAHAAQPMARAEERWTTGGALPSRGHSAAGGVGSTLSATTPSQLDMTIWAIQRSGARSARAVKAARERSRISATSGAPAFQSYTYHGMQSPSTSHSVPKPPKETVYSHACRSRPR